MNETTTDDAISGLHVGSHTHSVAKLAVGDVHTISRKLTGKSDPIAIVISDIRQKLARVVTATTDRVREKLPERRYTVNTGLMVGSQNQMYVCAVVERVK